MASRLETLTAQLKIELFRQWQTHENGVHMKQDTFDSIDFPALAVVAMDVLNVVDTLHAAVKPKPAEEVPQ